MRHHARAVLIGLLLSATFAHAATTAKTVHKKKKKGSSNSVHQTVKGAKDGANEALGAVDTAVHQAYRAITEPSKPREKP